MNMRENELERYQAVAKLIKASHYTVVFTGAGISTPSGIPDFRSSDTGLWEKNDPMLVASLTAFTYHPDRFYRWLRPLLQTSSQALPNLAHQAIAELEKQGFVQTVITQNIDSLHQKAGSINVGELHGSMASFHCPSCQREGEDSQALLDEILAGLIPACTQCGATMKPDITLYEEALPEKAWQVASDAVDRAEVMIVAGSSLEVIPASSLPYDAYRHGCRIIMVNLAPTYMDSHAEVVIHDDVAVVLPMILKQTLAEE
jgi:NAD-dependent deacetylase